MNAADIICEGLYAARIVAGMSILTAVYFGKRLRLHIAAVIAICLAVVAIGASFNPLSVILRKHFDISALHVINALWYSGLMLLCLGALCLCVKAHIGEYAFVLALSCLAESQVFGFMRLFVDMGVFELRVNTALSLSIEIAVSALFYGFLYYVFSRPSHRGLFCEILRRQIMTVYFFATAALNMFMRLGLQLVYEEVRGSGSAWVVNFVMWSIPLFIAGLDTFVVIAGNKQHENAMLDVMLSEREKQYGFLSQNMEAVNRQAHDLKRRIRALEFSTDDQRASAVEEMKRAVSLYDTAVRTGNIALDTVLYEKSLYCAEHGIRFSVMPLCGALEFMSPVDIYNMIGNMLDNAIEAVEKIGDADKRVISFAMRAERGAIVISSDNYFCGDVDIADGALRTTKTDGGLHGYGIKSMRRTAEKYGGVLEISVDGDVFIVRAVLPEPAKT